MFFLNREWQDPEAGIEAVLLHWQTTPMERQPNWRKAHPQTMMMPQPATTPVRRQSTFWVTPPVARKLRSEKKEEEEAPRFLLHSFYEVVQRGRTWNMGVTSQEMRLVTVSHVDPSAEYTQGTLYYSLDNLAHMNCAPMFVKGLSINSRLCRTLPIESLDNKDRRAYMIREKRIRQLSLPHIFYGSMWGPVGARALYSVYFRRDGAYNPFSERGFWLLRNGGFWEVTF